MSNNSNQSLLKTKPRPGVYIVILLVVGFACFLAGLFRPFTSLTKLWLFENQVSVKDGLVTLWNGGEIFLFLILFVFTVLFPAAKISALLALWLKPGLESDELRRIYHFTSNLGKWSMLDVFVVAILVMTIRSGVAEIRVQDGFFLFFASVLLTLCASQWTGHTTSRLEENGHENK